MRRLFILLVLACFVGSSLACSRSEAPAKNEKAATKKQKKKKQMAMSKEKKGYDHEAHQRAYGVFTEACKKEISDKCPETSEKRNECFKTHMSDFSPTCSKQFLAAELKKRRR